MTAARITQADLLAEPELILVRAERQATIITHDGRDRLALLPLPEYVQLTGTKLDGRVADPHFAELVARYHRDEPITFTQTLTFDLELDLIGALNLEAAAHGCSVDVVVNAILHLAMVERGLSAKGNQ